MKLRRYKGFSIIEALILMFVFGVVFTGLFSSIMVSMRWTAHSRADLDSFIAANACFEGISSLNTQDHPILTQNDLDEAMDIVVGQMGGGLISGDTNEFDRYIVGSLELKATFSPGISEGFSTIVLEIEACGKEQNSKMRFERQINSYSSEPVKFVKDAFRQRVSDSE